MCDIRPSHGCVGLCSVRSHACAKMRHRRKRTLREIRIDMDRAFDAVANHAVIGSDLQVAANQRVLYI